ncbi:MAG: toprim domain-containing protein, partial [Prevotella sp.]|nr:toprim domain-containing protein [Prevotella sp.]
LPEAFNPERCLFGLHLLAGDKKHVAVVESEKTAVIMSEAMPQYIWLAAGGLSMLSAEKLLPLQGRRVVLFPDTDPDGKAYAAWQRVAEEASEQMQQPIHVSRLLEDHATDAQKAAKIDIVDFLFWG